MTNASAGQGGIVRIEHDRDRPFVVVSKAVTECTAASWGLRGLLTYLLGKPNGWEVRMNQLETQAKDGRLALRSHFVEGRALGFILSETWREGGRVQYRHTIYERPLEKPVPGYVDLDAAKKKAAPSAQKKPKKASPEVGSCLRIPADGYPPTETDPLISNDPVSNEEQVIKTLAAGAAAHGEEAQEAQEAQGGTAQGQEPPHAESTPSQADVSPATGTKLSQATGTENVPPAAAPGTAHQVMCRAIAAVLWPGVTKFDEDQRKRTAAASKKLRTVELSPDDVPDLKRYVQARDTWRKGRLSPEILVGATADYQSECALGTWRAASPNIPLPAPVDTTPRTDDGEVDMAALIAGAPLNGSRRAK